MTIISLARPEIQALEPYKAAAQVDNTVRLNANEAPWTSGSDRFRRPLNRYPEIRPGRLREALAARYGCDPAQLLVTRGTSEAIDLLVRAFCRAGKDNIVTTAPTFSMYRHYAAVQGAAVRELRTLPEADFSLDVDRLLDTCTSNSRLIFLCSPNNPTGTLIPTAELRAVLEQRGDRSAVVVDEAYIEFSAAPSAVGLLAEYPNLLVLRTLSKALAFAGARCGAVMGPADVIAMLSAVQAPYALATPVVECVENALAGDGLPEAERSIGQLIAERDRLMAALLEFPFVRRIWPSAANFFLVELDNAPDLLEQAGRDRILLRYFGGDLADSVRITVGTAAENERLLALFAAVHGGRDGD